jgi:tRNA uridine 5-carboxymethylaminomethyl modification enzyme
VPPAARPRGQDRASGRGAGAARRPQRQPEPDPHLRPRHRPGRRPAHGLRASWDGRYRAGDLARLWPELADLSPAIAEQLEIEGRYAGYLDRQEADILAFRRDEALDLPASRLMAPSARSAECRAKLESIRPATLGQAGRIPA